MLAEIDYVLNGATYLEMTSSEALTLVHLSVDFGVQNALKLTYVRLEFQEFSQGLYPRTPVEKEEGG
jgi:hypothetical protein